MADGVTETVQDPNVEVQDNSITMEQYNLLQDQLKLERGKTSSLDSKVAELMQLTKDKEKAIEDIKTSKMSETERVTMELEKMKLDFQNERQSRTIADNKARALELMSENGIDKRYIDFIPLDNVDNMTAKLNSLSELAKETMQLGAKQVVKKIGGSIPTGGIATNGMISKEQLSSMSKAQINEAFDKGLIEGIGN